MKAMPVTGFRRAPVRAFGGRQIICKFRPEQGIRRTELYGTYIWHENNCGRCNSFMRIMVFMKRDAQDPLVLLPPDSDMKKPLAPSLAAARQRRPLYWALAALASLCIALSAQASVTKTAFPPSPIEMKIASSPGKDALYPALGLLAAVASTHILRRRRLAQLESIGVM